MLKTAYPTPKYLERTIFHMWHDNRKTFFIEENFFVDTMTYIELIFYIYVYTHIYMCIYIYIPNVLLMKEKHTNGKIISLNTNLPIRLWFGYICMFKGLMIFKLSS